MKKYVFWTLLSLVLAGCEKEKPQSTPPEEELPTPKEHFVYDCNSFIVSYHDCESIILDMSKNGNHPLMQQGDRFRIRLNANLEPCAAAFLELAPEGADEEAFRKRFEELCRRNGDTSYDYESHRKDHFRVVPYGEWFSQSLAGWIGVPIDRSLSDYFCLADDIVSVEFFTAETWDDEHPAGSSINDLIAGYIPAKYGYIQSGYSDESLLERQDRLLSELTADDWRCLSIFGPDFTFVSLPTNAACSYFTVTVRVTTEAGRTWESSDGFTYVVPSK